MLVALSGCARYTPLPLAQGRTTAASMAELDNPGVRMDGALSVADVAALAVANNPDLAAARAQRGVAQAQVFQAGLLANPVVTASLLPLAAGPAGAGPVGGGPAGSSTIGWNAGLSYDVRSLVTRGARREAARQNMRSLDANLLWQEWQTIAQARLLAVDIIDGDRVLALLARTRSLAISRASAVRAALAAGNATLATAAPDVSAEQAATGAYDDQTRLQATRRHQLAALLGLSPDAPLALAQRADLPDVSQAGTRMAMATLADRRPDLAALRYGYAAQDAKLRVAILSQFPNITFGVVGGSDNSNIRNVGPQIGLDLPIFDHNQGGIAVERATRVQLHAEYAARLAQASGAVQAGEQEIALLRRQIAADAAGLPEMRRDAQSAEAARKAGNLDERSALDLIGAYLAKEQLIATLEQSLDEQMVALATLTGAGLPPLVIQPPRGPAI